MDKPQDIARDPARNWKTLRQIKELDTTTTIVKQNAIAALKLAS